MEKQDNFSFRISVDERLHITNLKSDKKRLTIKKISNDKFMITNLYCNAETMKCIKNRYCLDQYICGYIKKLQNWLYFGTLEQIYIFMYAFKYKLNDKNFYLCIRNSSKPGCVTFERTCRGKTIRRHDLTRLKVNDTLTKTIAFALIPPFNLAELYFDNKNDNEHKTKYQDLIYSNDGNTPIIGHVALDNYECFVKQTFFNPKFISMVNSQWTTCICTYWCLKKVCSKLPRRLINTLILKDLFPFVIMKFKCYSEESFFIKFLK